MEGMGVYAVSKHGIEAFSDTLRLEMAKWQVQVSVIEPSGFLTGKLIPLYFVFVLFFYCASVWGLFDNASTY